MLTDCPSQISVVPEIVAVGIGVTVTTAEPDVLVPVQFASSIVAGSEYVVFAPGDTLITAMAVLDMKVPAGIPFSR